MRDGEIVAKINNLSKKIAMLYKQNVFTECRLRAFESIAATSTLWQRAWWIFAPAAFMHLVDVVQMKLMQDHDEQLRREAEEASKPKIVAPTPAQSVILNGR